MSIAHSDDTYDWWEVAVPASADETVWWYRFILIDGNKTVYYEDDAARTGGWGQPFDQSQDNSWQLTVYDAGFQTPDWIKNAVVYQVFPDRFRDGNPANNKPAGTFFYGEPGGTIYRSDTENWNTFICDPRANSNDACEGSWSKNFYGGDLQGLTDKLDYLQALGVTAIYLNPIFESPSNHGYDTTDYLSINEMFGTQADYDALIAGLQARMHLIVDGVFNHVSSDSKYPIATVVTTKLAPVKALTRPIATGSTSPTCLPEPDPVLAPMEPPTPPITNPGGAMTACPSSIQPILKCAPGSGTTLPTPKRPLPVTGCKPLTAGVWTWAPMLTPACSTT